jgi:hypothetical protein
MARTETLLKRYDLRELEALVERKRKLEERTLVRLQAKRKKLEAELKRIDKQVAKAAATTAKAGRSGGVVRRRPNARRLNEVSLADALVKVFKSRKSPVHYKDLTDTVLKRGLYKTRSKNLLSTVAVTLKRDKRFKKVEPGMYVMK